MNFFKGRAILWLLIPVAFIVAFLWDTSAPTQPNFIQEPSNPDYFLVDTHTIEFSENGLADRQFKSDKTLHYLFKQETNLENPQFSFTNKDNQQWFVTAQSAISKEMTEELFLRGQVKVSFAQSDSSQAILNTEQLTIDFATENAYTQEAVILQDQFYQLSAVGMSIDFYENLVHFKSQVVSEEL
ncbi:LPS export ABC transporter periplasmic protein LptC [Kangiella sp. TOML190]|uniref:LPS export ABC transporter periplasmic protein LptC n=1 Tax=Kangiella sp. TOML190 TaxID=2931351 RepID=UPI002040CFC7|nr:LPS export ABC transporter periplasmic protein LptC [Kangiella sp. TOML190]